MNNTERWDSIEKIFFELLDLPPADRAEHLRESSGSDVALKQEVEALLAAHESTTGLLLEDRFLNQSTDQPDNPDHLVGSRVGEYRLTSVIGRGGMGAVYKAARDDGSYEQDVAVKVIRSGSYQSDAVSRFKIERQVLARLEHENIARLLDGGTTETGMQFLVMEHVLGEPITVFADENRLTVDERLILFSTVCRALQYAHRNLVVHRDLKPGNILVSKEGQVKVIDFGIAKLLDSSSFGLARVNTRPESRLMTPEYASPEQVRGEEITTAADVYGLGVLLYELLTGRLPFRIPIRRPAEVERIICNEKPTRPSTVVFKDLTPDDQNEGAEEDTPQAIASARRLAPSRLSRTLRGDLDNIVLMALRKEPDRRYSSAEQLASDIANYLEGRPVIARKETFSYRTSKFVFRNRMGVGVVAVFFATLLGFSIFSARQARELAIERDGARQVTEILAGIFESQNPINASPDSTDASTVLDEGISRIEELEGHPEAQAELLSVLGDMSWTLGRQRTAAELEERALGLRRGLQDVGVEEMATSLYKSGNRRQVMGETKIATSYLKESLALRRSILPDDDGTVIKTGLLLGIVMHSDGKWAEADSVLGLWGKSEDLVSLPDNLETAQALSDLASYFKYKGELDRAESYARKAIDIDEAISGEESHILTEDLTVLGSILFSKGMLDEAREVAMRAVNVSRRVFPDGHIRLARNIQLLGTIETGSSNFETAERLLREASEIYERVDEEGALTSSTWTDLGHLYSKWGRLEEAEKQLVRTVNWHVEHRGPDYPMTLERRRLLGNLYLRQERYAKAESILLEIYKMYAAKRGADDSWTLRVEWTLHRLYSEWGRPAEAKKYRPAPKRP